MATTDQGVSADGAEGVSPKNNAAPSEQVVHHSLGSIANSLESLDLRADPDAQATVTDFIDFTEYMPSDMIRSLTLIGKLDDSYNSASLAVNDYTTTWAKLPELSPDQRPNAVQLRADISENLDYSLNSRVASHAEATRVSENVSRHYKRLNTILKKLKATLENYPTEEQQKSPVAVSKSPQLLRASKSAARTGENGERIRRQRLPMITVPGEVLAPYDHFEVYTDESEESSDEEDSDSLPRRTPARSRTPGTRIKVVKPPQKSHKAQKGPKPSSRTPKSNSTVTLPSSTVTATPVVLKPPPEDAVIGSADAPWLRLTAWELAKLRKRMKKNATWNPSETMILRELKQLGRGIDAYKTAKKRAEEAGQDFDGALQAPSLDSESGVQQTPEGAINADILTADEVQLSNRGMKLNEAKKLKREALAKQAAEEAEESARQLREAARLFMSSEPTPASKGGAAKTVSKSRLTAKMSGKRTRDSMVEGETDLTDTPSARPPIKRTKTETPVPIPQLKGALTAQAATAAAAAGETPVPPPQLTPSGSNITPQSTTPVPIPIPGQDASIAAARSVTSPAGSAGLSNTTVTTIPIKPPAETYIPPPNLSPKKSTTPILPPVREVIKRETRGDAAKKTLLETPQQAVQQSQRQSSAAPSVKNSSSRAATPGTTPAPELGSRRPGSRGKAMSQEPQSSLAAERGRRASTARNTPAPEPRQPRKKIRRPAPGVVNVTNSGRNSAVGKRKAAPKRKKKDKGAPTEVEMEEVDDEGNPIDPDEPRYCICNRVSFGTMISCDNDDCDKEWFHLECVGLTDIPPRTTKWYCPDCRVKLNIGERGEVSARGIKM